MVFDIVLGYSQALFKCSQIEYDIEYSKAVTKVEHIDGLVQDRRISIAVAMEILQSCTKPSIYQTLNLQKTSHISPWWVSYGMSNVNVLENIDDIIMALHCIYMWKQNPITALSHHLHTMRLIQSMYENVRSRVHVGCNLSEAFSLKVGVHQGSCLSLRLFIKVLDALSQEFGTECPLENLYADDLIIITEFLEKQQEKLILWKTNMEGKGLRVNMSKANVLISVIWQQHNDALQHF